MARANHFVDVGAAMVTRDEDGAVVVDDPGSPWLVRLWVEVVDGRARVTRLQVDVRDHAAPITIGRLGRLPVAQLLQVAAAQSAHPNEAFYRMLAEPKRPGQRDWDDGHWRRVLTVFEWAVETGRPGGGYRAVADLWGVARNPTAYRWVATARRVVDK